MSDRKVDRNKEIRYGGQAVIEGVMMRGPKYFAVACRKPASGEIAISQEEVPVVFQRKGWTKLPIIRGIVAFFDAMYLGMKTLTYSANIAMEDLQVSESTKTSQTTAEDGAKQSDAKPNGKVADAAVGLSMVLGLVIGVFVFVALPNLVAQWTTHGILGSKPTTGAYGNHSIYKNVIEGVLRLVFFVGYVFVISRIKDIRRVFEYHGAEHKVINSFEADESLSLENAKKYTTIHPRCGTAFLLLVIFVAILAHIAIGWDPIWYIRIAKRLLLLFPVAGISYELIRLAGSHKDNWFLKALVSPGLLMQRITTQEPSDDQIEVAIVALNGVIEKEKIDGLCEK